MENMPVFFTQKEINSIFSFFTVSCHSTLWIIDESYQHELFISPNFEEETGITLAAMQERWTVMFDKMPQVHPSNKPDKVIRKLLLRNISNQSVTYCITGKNEKNLYIKDTLLSTLKYKATDQVLKVGILEYITLKEYEESLSRGRENNICFFEVFEKINEGTARRSENLQNFQPANSSSFARINDEDIKITRREGECLAHLLRGLSSKHIAKNLNISPRTVEIHLENVKRKTNTLSRIELVSKIQNANDFIAFLN